ncbi:hypothetical protein BH11PLA2_BH11PLA2_46400 [soil metagenome]
MTFLPEIPKAKTKTLNSHPASHDPWLNGDYDPFLSGYLHDYE